jgi:hypothetical protein
MIFAMDYGVTLKVGASPGVSYAQSEQVAPVWHTSDTPTRVFDRRPVRGCRSSVSMGTEPILAGLAMALLGLWPTTPDTVGLSLAVANVTTSAVRAYALC